MSEEQSKKPHLLEGRGVWEPRPITETIAAASGNLDVPLGLRLALCCVGILAACAHSLRSPVATTLMVFLTRDGCVNTDAMRTRLDEALRSLGRRATYQVIDADTLPQSEVRRGYGTPTVLVDNRDLFNMPKQKPQDPPT